MVFYLSFAFYHEENWGGGGGERRHIHGIVYGMGGCTIYDILIAAILTKPLQNKRTSLLMTRL